MKNISKTANGHTEQVKDGFNWVVLLFGPICYLFNNMIGKGIAWLIVEIVAGALLSSLPGVVKYYPYNIIY